MSEDTHYAPSSSGQYDQYGHDQQWSTHSDEYQISTSSPDAYTPSLSSASTSTTSTPDIQTPRSLPAEEYFEGVSDQPPSKGCGSGAEDIIFSSDIFEDDRKMFPEFYEGFGLYLERHRDAWPRGEHYSVNEQPAPDFVDNYLSWVGELAIPKYKNEEEQVYVQEQRDEHEPEYAHEHTYEHEHHPEPSASTSPPSSEPVMNQFHTRIDAAHNLTRIPTPVSCGFPFCTHVGMSDTLWKDHIRSTHYPDARMDTLVQCGWAGCCDDDASAMMRSSLVRHMSDVHLLSKKKHCPYCHKGMRGTEYDRRHGDALSCSARAAYEAGDVLAVMKREACTWCASVVVR